MNEIIIKILEVAGMSLALLSIFLLVVFCKNRINAKRKRERHDICGSIIVEFDDDSPVLYLETDITPEEIAKRKTVKFRVKTFRPYER